jgi:hypothetical protein
MSRITNPNDWWFPLRRGLLTPEHYDRIGNSIWLFVYFLSRIRVNSETGEINAIFTDEDISESTGMSIRNVRYWRQRLVQEKYITQTRMSHGYRITVNNWKKDVSAVPSQYDSSVIDSSPEEDCTPLSNIEKEEKEEKEERNIYTGFGKVHVVGDTEDTAFLVKGPPIIYEPCDEEGNPIKEKKKKEPKEPTHPAIVAFRRTTGRYPPKTNYDWIIDILGDSPDELKLHECKANWDRRGYNGNSLKWVEWYRDGIPKQVFKRTDNAFMTPDQRKEYSEWENQ